MSVLQKDERGPAMAWQLFAPLPTSVRREEDLQGALRGDIALVDEAEKKATAWMDRRRRAFDSGLKALGELLACLDPFVAAAIYGGWLSGSLGRIAADLGDAQDFAIKAATVGQRTAEAMVEDLVVPGRRAWEMRGRSR